MGGMNMKNEQALQEAPAGKLLLQLCIPTIVVMLVIVVYNMADIFFMGKTGDTDQVAAISMSSPIFSVLQGIGTLLGGGGCIAISMALGKKEMEHIKKVSSFCCYAALALGLVFAVIVNIFMAPIIRMLGVSSQVAGFAEQYIRILALGAPAVLFANVYANLVRADGAAVQSMIANGVGTVANIILDPILILGFHMGITGAAIATVMGNVLSSVYLVYYVMRRQKNYSLRPSDFTLKPAISLHVMALGVPMAVSTLLMSFCHVFSNRLMASYGDIVIAANGVSSKAGMLIGMIAMGICMGMQPAISYNYGAGDLKRMNHIIKVTGAVTVVTGSILTLFCFIFRDQFIGAFIANEELISYGQKLIIGGLVTGPVCGLYQLSTSFLQSTGKTSYATLVSLLRQGLVYLPMIYLMNSLFGLDGLIFAGAVSDVISILIGGGLSLRWNRQIRISAETCPA